MNLKWEMRKVGVLKETQHYVWDTSTGQELMRIEPDGEESSFALYDERVCPNQFVGKFVLLILAQRYADQLCLSGRRVE